MSLAPPQITSIVIFCITSLCLTLIIGKELDDFKSIKERPARILSGISVIVYIFYISQILLAIPIACNTFGVANGELIACDYLSIIVMFLFFVSKGSYYTIYVVKLHIIFGNSTELRYSQKFLFLLSFFAITCSTILAVIFAFDMNRFSYYDLETQNCIYAPPIYLVLPTAVLDMITTAILLYLFIKKLRVLVKASLETPQHHLQHFESTLQFVMLKTTVLVCFSIFSTFLLSLINSMVTQYTHIHGTVHIDLVINAVCVLLIKHKYTKQYKRLCRGCQLCVVCCCAKQMMTANIVQHVETQLSGKIASHTAQSSGDASTSPVGTPPPPDITTSDFESP